MGQIADHIQTTPNDNHTQMPRADFISHLVTCCCCGYVLLWLHCGGIVWRYVLLNHPRATGGAGARGEGAGWRRLEGGRRKSRRLETASSLLWIS